MCEETIDANTCRGHTLQDFMTTVPIQLANKKKKRNATKWHKLSTPHTITHTLTTVDFVFGHTCVLPPVIAHPSRPKNITTHRRASIPLPMRWRERQTPLTNDQTLSAPSDQILAEKVISSLPSNSNVANCVSSRGLLDCLQHALRTTLSQPVHCVTNLACVSPSLLSS